MVTHAHAPSLQRPAPEESTLPLRLLRVVAAVAEHRSAAGAAQALHRSTSAITRAVQRAEQRLGVALFERGSHGMVATPAGSLLATRAHRALAELRQSPAPQVAARATDAMLEALIAVAVTRSEAGAAARLERSQPAVHQALRGLEHAARLRLFERSERGTRLTEAGERLLQRAGVALAELRAGHDELDAWRGRSGGRVTLGALPMTGDVLVPQALNRLYQALPDVQVTVHDGTYEALLQQLRRGDIEVLVGPLRGTASAADIVEETLFVDRLRPVVRSGHPLLQATRARGSLRALLRWPWIGPLPGTPARAAFERAFAAAGLPMPVVRLQANSPAVLRSVLLGGDSVALVSTLQIRAELESGLLALLPVRVLGTERPIGVAQRRGGLASPAAAALLNQLRAVAADAAGS